MKRIKIVTEKLKQEAHENVQGFDHTELCYNSIFHLLNDNGVFYNAINQITKTTVTTENSTKFSDELKDLKNNNDTIKLKKILLQENLMLFVLKFL